VKDCVGNGYVLKPICPSKEIIVSSILTNV